MNAKGRLDRIQRRHKAQASLNTALVFVERGEGWTEERLQEEIEKLKAETLAKTGYSCRLQVVVID